MNCTWHGWLKKTDALKVMSNADIFVFPSLHEGVPTVVMEALSMGLPVICLDRCGQGDIITGDCGIKIPVSTPKQVIKELASSLSYLMERPAEIERLSKGAIVRASEFTWAEMVQQMLIIYQDAIKDWTSNRRES